jgi:hypothetical protein
MFAEERLKEKLGSGLLDCVFYFHSKNLYHVGQFHAPDFISDWSILVGYEKRPKRGVKN